MIQRGPATEGGLSHRRRDVLSMLLLYKDFSLKRTRDLHTQTWALMDVLYGVREFFLFLFFNKDLIIYF